MYREFLIIAALLVAICFLVTFIRQVVACNKTAHGKCFPGDTLVFFVKDQQDTIEGLVRQVSVEAWAAPVQVIAVDFGSIDQTKMILDRISAHFLYFNCMDSNEHPVILKKVYDLCLGSTIYCFDLRHPINYNLMSKTIHSILNGSRASLYRTKVLYKNEPVGQSNHS